MAKELAGIFLDQTEWTAQRIDYRITQGADLVELDELSLALGKFALLGAGAYNGVAQQTGITSSGDIVQKKVESPLTQITAEAAVRLQATRALFDTMSGGETITMGNGVPQFMRKRDEAAFKLGIGLLLGYAEHFRQPQK